MARSPRPSLHSAMTAHGFGWLKIAAFSLIPLYTRRHESDVVVRLRKRRPQQVNAVLRVEMLIHRVHRLAPALRRRRVRHHRPRVALDEDFPFFVFVRADLHALRGDAAHVPLAVPQFPLARGFHFLGQRPCTVCASSLRPRDALPLPRMPAAPSDAGTTPWRSRRRPGSGNRSSRRASLCRCRSAPPAPRKNPARASDARRLSPRLRRRTAPLRRTARYRRSPSRTRRPTPPATAHRPSRRRSIP